MSGPLRRPLDAHGDAVFLEYCRKVLDQMGPGGQILGWLDGKDWREVEVLNITKEGMFRVQLKGKDSPFLTHRAYLDYPSNVLKPTDVLKTSKSEIKYTWVAALEDSVVEVVLLHNKWPQLVNPYQIIHDETPESW